MARRRTLFILLSVLGLFLVGTVVVLSSITYYLSIDPSAYLTTDEVPILDGNTRWNASEHGQKERIPRILHQTWRTENLPTRWKGISQECRDMMPDYEYLLWTDDSSREFIAENYPWFLDTFNDYKYAIQRADAIRYFVLHHYGGVYLDLDVGCLRPLDPLLVYPVILPKTIPVGVSNDLMFAEKGHPFLAQTIHNLVTFDHNWILNYPTVMFSTGPMFLSAQYGIYTSSHAGAQGDPVRILPKSLYGKNAKEGEAPDSFFSHFYGSSWHADDAAFIGFLGHWGKVLLWVGLIVLIGGLAIMVIPGKQRRYTLRRIGGYDVLFPRWSSRTGQWHFHLPRSEASSQSDSNPTSPTYTDGYDDERLPFEMRPVSPASTESSFAGDQLAGRPSPLAETFRRVRNRVAAFTHTIPDEVPRTPHRPGRRRFSRGYLFFLPAIFTTQPTDIEAGSEPPVPLFSRPIARSDRPPRYMDLNDGAKNQPAEAEAQLIDLGAGTEHSSSSFSRRPSSASASSSSL
ncbi:glycosyltransferase family 32 protein [Lentinula edodes]|uniref:Glycosyltransferase family 32 protein n=1 Tax=Lentinula edodes TaxID=5353 RepID=A0A1Q3DW24_LENED|nr:glycosyltransferase family 32 protein [Lentinula edodes]